MGKTVLRGLTKEVEIETPTGVTLLRAAIDQDVDWNHRCTKGTCARCRCIVEEGAQYLGEVTDAEWNRLEEGEFDQGYRLACQAVIETEGDIRATNKPYI
ncbi:2Fe-2S iron-sulfur cluster-binding protein [Paenibacillus marinisediminis]